MKVKVILSFKRVRVITALNISFIYQEAQQEFLKLRFKQVTHGIIFLHWVFNSFGLPKKLYSRSVGLKWILELFQMHLNIHLLHIHGLIQKYYSGNFHFENLFSTSSSLLRKGLMTISSSAMARSVRKICNHFNPVIRHLNS
jgi:hypothetical protein